LTQVAGRAGRGEAGGEVIIQTYAPEHYALRTSQKHDYEKFYEEEIKSRQELLFPPFVSLVKITLRARNEMNCKKHADQLAAMLKSKIKDLYLAGPAPAPIARVRGYYRWNILIKGKNRSIMCEELRKALARYRRPSGTIVTIDVDPISM
jgi:primosomal protein N' (replication factor Y)